MQFDVFVNPLPAARAGFPFVVVLQGELADTGRTRVVAFLAPLTQVRNPGMPVMPKVRHNGSDYLVFLPEITNLPVAMLGRPVGDVSDCREAIVAALDRLFLGVWPEGSYRRPAARAALRPRQVRCIIAANKNAEARRTP